MNTETIVRAWKDPEFRASLSAEQRASLPDSPAGRPFNEMDEVAVRDAVGGSLSRAVRNYASSGFPDCTFTLTNCHPHCAL